MSQEWYPWHSSWGREYRIVETDGAPDFGQIWYNAESDMLFIRRVTHEFEDNLFQMMEKKTFKNCTHIGDL